MARRVMRWSMQKMIWMIGEILKNQFDCFLIIEGNRGLGKSTLAIHFARRIARAFKKEGFKEKYKFNWDNTLIYTKKQTLNFFHKWQTIGIADEMINVTFNRDFYNEDQKNIIKMINMNRDHKNFFIACVPQFQTLDNQINNLCKVRISVVRRGMAIIQTPNKIIYAKDKWDQATNEKIERDWIRKGVTKPHYAKLTTFRGVFKFPPLHPTVEKKYQEVKDRKRNLVAKEEMGITDDDDEKNPIKETIKMLKESKVRNGIFLDGLAVAYGFKGKTFRQKIIDALKEKGEDHKLVNYFWEKKAKEKASTSI